MNTPDTPRDETTPLDPVTQPTADTTWAPAPGTTATETRPVQPVSPQGLPAREYVRGPAPFAIVLGLLGLVVAAVTLFAEVVGIDVPWGDLGPWTVVGAGVLVLLVGGLGLRASRGQD